MVSWLPAHLASALGLFSGQAMPLGVHRRPEGPLGTAKGQLFAGHEDGRRREAGWKLGVHRRACESLEGRKEPAVEGSDG